ncbi:hypothetical protein A8924_7149 [Saccharopolyspora erythraea NRRL 2338]|uniref:Zinc finger protein n=1 Tax=Saccharopolyspora erythraea TaxID=1836 RepID=A0ABN1CQK6_SACER|nr:hypothetical protein [Saccharopolyspora erythraea]EQD84179.1 hypothetical protein N599_21415 [Saccharopolyspora erythraea D]PFG99599.1 hypothetical protein A8924_7149 [Saccharopolyspora erythraea NRRL 2338]QRK89491.1 hypothetical protein JQX30_33980 [Saccharopolyspora erythraea]
MTLTFVWRPIPGAGRHAFPVAALKLAGDAKATAYCRAEADAAQLHDRSEMDWICETTCAACWKALSARE